MSDVSGAWNCRIRASWASSIDYLENRASLLRSLSELSLGVLEIDGEESRFADEDSAFRINADGFTLDHNRPDRLATAELFGVLQQALRPVLQHLIFQSQHLRDLGEISYANATALSAKRFLAGLPDQMLQSTDCAILLDGVGEQGARFQAEYGVIDSDQAGGRLARTIGRIHGPPTIPPRLDGLPTVALFVDCSWVTTSGEPGWVGDLEGAEGFLRKSLAATDTLTDSLKDRLLSISQSDGSQLEVGS